MTRDCTAENSMFAINVPNSRKRRARAKSQALEYIALRQLNSRLCIKTLDLLCGMKVHLRLLSEDYRSYDC